MLKLRVQVVILDFDGVIVESVGIKDQAFEILFEDYPQHLNQIIEYQVAHNAATRLEKFKYITENILQQSYTTEKEAQFSEQFSQLVFQNIVKCPFVPGAKEFLNFFTEKVPVYLVSKSPDEELDKILEIRELKQHFKRIYGASWMKADAIREILKREKLSSTEVVFIGDSPEDYYAAKETGAFFIGRYSNKSFSDTTITVYNDLFEIKNILE